MKIHTKAVHAGDRKKPAAQVPVTTPIYTASSYFYDTMEQLDRVFAGEEPGFCYSRYDNPTNAALEELVTALENGHGALACASGMAALQMAVLAALTRPAEVASWRRTRSTARRVKLLMTGAGAVRRRDATSSTSATWTRCEAALTEDKPGLLLMETISNPLLRVARARQDRGDLRARPARR